jgi:hypothetical protein
MMGPGARGRAGLERRLRFCFLSRARPAASMMMMMMMIV